MLGAGQDPCQRCCLPCINRNCTFEKNTPLIIMRLTAGPLLARVSGEILLHEYRSHPFPDASVHRLTGSLAGRSMSFKYTQVPCTVLQHANTCRTCMYFSLPGCHICRRPLDVCMYACAGQRQLRPWQAHPRRHTSHANESGLRV